MSDRDDRVDRLYAQVLEQPAAAREAVLEASSEPQDIKDEVRAVLEAEDYAGDFLQGTAVGAEATPPLADGTVLGQYRIERVVGRGGMGIVYEARDTRLNRRVALKSVAPGLAREDRQRQRLQREARAAASLTHPGIATVYALEEFEGQLFIASEFLDGESLRAEMERARMPLNRVLATGLELARALAAAHDRHVVHRDLKPENVIRTTAGVLKILDFGLAQIVEPQSLISHTRTLTRARLTEEGMVAGTPPYMSPEQLRGRPTDFRTDQFALGVVLYELATGRHPFAGSSIDSVIAQILATAPATPELPQEMPATLWLIVERCLCKDPEGRYASTRDLAAELESVLGSGALGSGVQRAEAAAPAAVLAASHSSVPLSLDRVETARNSSAVYWWRFHQLAAALAYWSMIWPAWLVHRSLGRVGLAFFFALLAAVVIAGNLRLHLWFSSRVYPEDLSARQQEVAQWIRWADVAFAALLVIGGVALPEDRAGWAAVLISFGIGSALAFLFIEPATARAAFRHPR